MTISVGMTYFPWSLIVNVIIQDFYCVLIIYLYNLFINYNTCIYNIFINYNIYICAIYLRNYFVL